jgi:hypothetical protein
MNGSSAVRASASGRMALLGGLLSVTLAASNLTGCKSSAPRVSDAGLTENIQGALGADNAIAGQPVQVAVQSGVATLSGSVSNDAQRTLAARDAAAVAGVAKVVNQIGVNTPPPATASVAAPPPVAPAPAPIEKSKALLKPAPPPPHQAAPIERREEPVAEGPPPPPLAPMPEQPAAAPAPPPPPSFKNVTIAAGDSIPVRVTQTLDSGTTQPDTAFSGVVASDIIINGLVAIPAGTNVSGHVDAVQDAAHFKGSSLLTVSLTAINRRGDHIAVSTDPYTVQGKGRGTNTAEKTGGGAAVGAILGGIFGGGKGAAIGAAAGAGAGAGSNAVTRGQQVQIASESVVRFHLSAPITLKVRSDGGEKHADDNGLRPRGNP